MGNNMGNNNTSAIKEEDNLGEADKNGFQVDPNETSIAKDVAEKASIDINQPGKDTWQDEGHAENVKGKAQTITIDETKDEDSQDKTIGFASNHTTTVLENDSMKGDTHASDVNMDLRQHCDGPPAVLPSDVDTTVAAQWLRGENTTASRFCLRRWREDNFADGRRLSGGGTPAALVAGWNEVDFLTGGGGCRDDTKLIRALELGQWSLDVNREFFLRVCEMVRVEFAGR
ncbi:hypothetical protein V8G54_024194 [Vigna mungo]|uniref:Uncharacterized protein n=1 Tax=Vigna mungo TaxID=3915 RepID=A0AAQ3N6W9_VIGMU